MVQAWGGTGGLTPDGNRTTGGYAQSVGTLKDFVVDFQSSVLFFYLGDAGADGTGANGGSGGASTAVTWRSPEGTTGDGGAEAFAGVIVLAGGAGGFGGSEPTDPFQFTCPGGAGGVAISTTASGAQGRGHDGNCLQGDFPTSPSGGGGGSGENSPNNFGAGGDSSDDGGGVGQDGIGGLGGEGGAGGGTTNRAEWINAQCRSETAIANCLVQFDGNTGAGGVGGGGFNQPICKGCGGGGGGGGGAGGGGGGAENAVIASGTSGGGGGGGSMAVISSRECKLAPTSRQPNPLKGPDPCDTFDGTCPKQQGYVRLTFFLESDC